MMRGSKGFTLAELLVGVVVMGIMGMALTQMLIGDSRFVAQNEAMMNARQSARAAMNTMGVELGMVGHDGLTAASPTSVTIRVPYAFGILCGKDGSSRIGWLIQSDSMMQAAAVAEGLAWRSVAGTYTFMSVSSEGPAGPVHLVNCTANNIATDNPAGQLTEMLVASDTMPVGQVFYLYQTIRYQFAASVDLPGRLGLWRKRGSDADEELLAPFDNTARFAFFVGASGTALVMPPADLSTVIGLELNLVGSSETTPQGMSQPPTFAVITRVNFLNNQ